MTDPYFVYSLLLLLLPQRLKKLCQRLLVVVVAEVVVPGCTPRGAGQRLEGVDDGRSRPPVADGVGAHPPVGPDVVAVAVAPLVTVDGVGPVSDNRAVLALSFRWVSAAGGRAGRHDGDGIVVCRAGAGSAEGHGVRYLAAMGSDCP